MLKETILSIGGILFIANVAIVGLTEDCSVVDGSGKEIMFLPAVEIPYGKGKICFEEEADYQTFKMKVLQDFNLNKNLAAPETIGYVENLEQAKYFLIVMFEEGVRENVDKEVFESALIDNDIDTAKGEVDKLISDNGIVYIRKIK